MRRKIDSTRGLFVSVAGFRSEVLDEASDLLDLILIDGQDLALILEGRISLIEALQLKLDKAAQQGLIFYPLAQHLSSASTHRGSAPAVQYECRLCKRPYA